VSVQFSRARSRVGKWRGGLGAAYPVLTLSVVSASLAAPCSVSTSPSSNRTCRFAASGSPTGFATRATAACVHAAFLGLARGFRDRRIHKGVARPSGQSLDARSRLPRARSQAPSLSRRYPASLVLRACPPPHRGPACPSRASGWGTAPPLGFPVLRSISSCRHAVAITPVGPQTGSLRSPEVCDSGLPHPFAGSAPTLAVSRPAQRSRVLRPTCSRHRLSGTLHRRLRRVRYLPRRSDCYRLERKLPGGIDPTEDRRLCTAHKGDSVLYGSKRAIKYAVPFSAPQVFLIASADRTLIFGVLAFPRSEAPSAPCPGVPTGSSWQSASPRAGWSSGTCPGSTGS
jgi:hypothetical protein